MLFKIVPWLLVLSISLAYAFPAEQNSDENDPNHVHDEHCTHPIKEAFNKVKTSISNAYQKTKQTIGNAYNSVKNSFKKPETEKKPDGTQGNEGTESTGSDNFGSAGNLSPGRNDGGSFSGGNNFGSGNLSPGRNDGGSFGGNDNTGSTNNGDSSSVDTNNGSSDSNTGNNSGTSNVGGNTGDQRNPPSDSEVEQLINVRFRNTPKRN